MDPNPPAFVQQMFGWTKKRDHTNFYSLAGVLEIKVSRQAGFTVSKWEMVEGIR